MLHHRIFSAMPMAIPGDVDGDGDQDLALFDLDEYVLYRRLGPASWALEPRRAGGPAAKFADVDADGDLDGVCCGGGSDEFDTYGEPSTRVSLNDGDGGFATTSTAIATSPRRAAGRTTRATGRGPGSTTAADTSRPAWYATVTGHSPSRS